MNFLSLGESCQTAHQIRRWTNSSERYFFDWIISDIKVVKKVLLNFNEEKFLSRENICLADKAVRLLETTTGVRFQHDFKVDTNGRHSLEVTDDELFQVKKKYLYLRGKTLEYIESNQVIPIYYDWRGLGDEFCLKVLDILVELPFPSINKRIVIASTKLSKTQYTSKGLLFKLDEPGELEQRYKWRGDDSCWDKLFLDCEERFSHSD
jgi:hypothetical protein